MKAVTVKDIKIIDLTPKLKNKALEKLLPTRLFPMRLEFNVAGVSNAVSNAIRRTVMCELLVRGLHAEHTDMKTNDMFIISEMIIKRLRMIPIDQTTPIDAVFSLDVANDTADIIDVKSGLIKISSANRSPIKIIPFNETFTLFTLNPGKFFKLDNIRIEQEYGFQPEYGSLVMTCNATSLAVDQKPINLYD